MNIDYYRIVNRFTRIEEHRWIIPQLTWDIDFLFRTVKSILIHPIDTKSHKIKYDRTQNGIYHALTTTTEKILSCEKLAPYLQQQIVPLATSPHDRAILSCDHHALLFTSLARNSGIAARARTGYSRYLVKNALVPHWIAEIYDENNKTWFLVDPERCIRNVEREDFLFAHQAWKLKNQNPGMFFPGYSNSKDRQGIKYALICDINCVFKNELLGYEWRHKSHNRKKPLIAHASYERLDEKLQNAIDMAADCMEDPDSRFEELKNFYEAYIGEPETDIG